MVNILKCFLSSKSLIFCSLIYPLTHTHLTHAFGSGGFISHQNRLWECKFCFSKVINCSIACRLYNWELFKIVSFGGVGPAVLSFTFQVFAVLDYIMRDLRTLYNVEEESHLNYQQLYKLMG